jgi:hypothetical protein
MSRQYDRYPKLWRAFALTHTSLRWTSGDGFVGEDSDEHLTLSLQETGDSHSARLNLVVLDPPAIECLKAIFAKI